MYIYIYINNILVVYSHIIKSEYMMYDKKMLCYNLEPINSGCVTFHIRRIHLSSLHNNAKQKC